jgi:hypothetical protein
MDNISLNQEKILRRMDGVPTFTDRANQLFHFVLARRVVKFEGVGAPS